MARQDIEKTYIKWWMGAEVIPENDNPGGKSYACTNVEYLSQPSGFYGIVRLTLDGYGEMLVSPKDGGFRPRKSDVNILKIKNTHK